MEYNTWLLYLGVISAIIFIPGPSALLCMSHGLKFGKAKSMATVFAGAVAALVLMGISIAGLGAILAASETSFLFIKLLGACYLIYLGISAWRNSFALSRTQSDLGTNDIESNIKESSFFLLFRKGFMVGISNPKDILFFTALFPSFINNDLSPFTQYASLAGTWFVVDIAAMFLYASLGSKISPWFSKIKNQQRLERTTGGFFIFTGSALIASSTK